MAEMDETLAETERPQPKLNMDRNLERALSDPVIRVLLVVAVLLPVYLLGTFAYGGFSEDQASAAGQPAVQERIEALEARYSITVDSYSLRRHGEWTIDGKDYICEFDGFAVKDADSTLSCVAAGELVDFAELN